MNWKKEELKLEEIRTLYEGRKEHDERIQGIIEKIYRNFTEDFPEIYQKYCRDIRFACENGLDVPYEELAGDMPEDVFEYSVFEQYFNRLKKLVKEQEENLDVVMDLISAKERAESLCVIFLEAEVQLNQLQG